MIVELDVELPYVVVAGFDEVADDYIVLTAVGERHTRTGEKFQRLIVGQLERHSQANCRLKRRFLRAATDELAVGRFGYASPLI